MFSRKLVHYRQQRRRLRDFCATVLVARTIKDRIKIQTAYETRGWNVCIRVWKKIVVFLYNYMDNWPIRPMNGFISAQEYDRSKNSSAY